MEGSFPGTFVAEQVLFQLESREPSQEAVDSTDPTALSAFLIPKESIAEDMLNGTIGETSQEKLPHEQGNSKTLTNHKPTIELANKLNPRKKLETLHRRSHSTALETIPPTHISPATVKEILSQTANSLKPPLHQSKLVKFLQLLNRRRLPDPKVPLSFEDFIHLLED